MPTLTKLLDVSEESPKPSRKTSTRRNISLTGNPHRWRRVYVLQRPYRQRKWGIHRLANRRRTKRPQLHREDADDRHGDSSSFPEKHKRRSMLPFRTHLDTTENHLKTLHRYIGAYKRHASEIAVEDLLISLPVLQHLGIVSKTTVEQKRDFLDGIKCFMVRDIPGATPGGHVARLMLARLNKIDRGNGLYRCCRCRHRRRETLTQSEQTDCQYA